MNPSLQALLGLGLLLGLAWLLTEDRRRVPWRTVAAGVLLCLALVLLLLKLPAAAALLAQANGLVDGLEAATRAGTGFVFGYLGGAPPPWAETGAGSSFVLAFRALPLVLVISALSALLFHWRVLPAIVHGFAALLRGTLGLGGAVGLSAAANVFVGMVEAPLVVRPYLARMSRGELFIVMNCGMATIAGTVLVLYASMLSPLIPEALSHLLVASFAATPMAIAVAVIMVPPDGRLDAAPVKLAREDPNAVAAITRGTLEGLQLLLNVIAMLIVFVALVALVNALLALLPPVAGAPLTLERGFGWVFAPLAWACGVPWSEAAVAGQLLGKKTVLNELVAYAELARLPADALSPRSRVLMIYALCGFANFGSLGIMLGGMSAMMPAERRAELAQLASRSVLAGLLSTCATAAVVALVI
ncbi:MAG TPA: nucleoside transporter C-terminal domain-containing protein [Burkholderiaceae bacterium]|nr:nucleoside transporter C-terminal domain-containing protein [Burkholderiaceae bacterium]